MSEGSLGENCKRPRFVPDRPFPHYAYVPGRFPHPKRSPKGHSFGVLPGRVGPLDPNRWDECRPYLYGLDLFNYGYYWEAHEVWEVLWHGCGREGLAADFIKGLIKLAAAGVKAREGKPEGMKRHALRARGLFEGTILRLGPEYPRYMGLSLSQLINFATEVSNLREVARGKPERPVEVVFRFVLRPVR